MNIVWVRNTYFIGNTLNRLSANFNYLLVPLQTRSERHPLGLQRPRGPGSRTRCRGGGGASAPARGHAATASRSGICSPA